MFIESGQLKHNGKQGWLMGFPVGKVVAELVVEVGVKECSPLVVAAPGRNPTSEVFLWKGRVPRE